MLSRTAENLYWLSRYVERAEYLARTIDATLRVTALPNTYIGKTNEWDSALLTAGVSASFYEVYEEADERNVVDYLSFSPANPSSIRSCIENARLNSRSVRTALTSEMWDTINSAWIELQETWGKGTTSREELTKFLRFVQETSLRFDGSAYRTMLRNDTYWFSRLGLHLERADNTARILDVKYHVLFDPAFGLGADRLSLGLSRNPETLADRGPSDPQRFAAAVAGQLLRQPGAQPRSDRRRLWPPGRRAAPRPRRPQSPRAQQHG
jgi:uncharacterized alpha-E superfamily protein